MDSTTIAAPSIRERSNRAAASLFIAFGLISLIAGLAGIYATQDLNTSIHLLAQYGYSGFEHIKTAAYGATGLGVFLLVVGFAARSKR